MKKTKQKKQQEKVLQEPSKPIVQAESELEQKVKRFRAKGRE